MSRSIHAFASAGARILKVALDFDALLSSGKSQACAIIVLKGRKDQYDPNVLEVISSVNTDVKAKVMSVGVADLQDGMILGGCAQRWG